MFILMFVDNEELNSVFHALYKEDIHGYYFSRNSAFQKEFVPII